MSLICTSQTLQYTPILVDEKHSACNVPLSWSNFLILLIRAICVSKYGIFALIVAVDAFDYDDDDCDDDDDDDPFFDLLRVISVA